MSARGKALRAQAAALRAQADAIDAEAEAIDAESTTKSSEPDWVPVRGCGLPRGTVKKLGKSGDVRVAIIGRESHVHRGDLAAWASNQAMRTEPVVQEAAVVPMGPYHRAIADAAKQSRKAS